MCFLIKLFNVVDAELKSLALIPFRHQPETKFKKRMQFLKALITESILPGTQ